MAFLCAIPVLSALLSGCAPEAPLAVGYVEGDFALIAPVEPARIEAVSVARGARVAAGDTVVQMETRDAEIALARARAELARAQSQLADLEQGKRAAEIRMAEASLTSARAQLAEAERELERQSGLFTRAVIARAQLDQASTTRDVAAARVAELEANLAVARLPARGDQIAAASAAVEQQKAALQDAEWRLAQRSLTAPAVGMVTDIIRHPGEIAGPQAPVLSILPDGATKVRLYLPQAALAQVSVGTELTLRCDGCTGQLHARVSYIATEPEFTPPVIYSLQARQKLMFLIEATPLKDAAALKPGQIVDAVLPEPGK